MLEVRDASGSGTLGGRLLGVIALVRPVAAGAGAAQVAVGGACTVGVKALETLPVLAAIISIFLIIAVANVVNDLADCEADVISRPGRPLPAGAVSRRNAVCLAAACAVGGCVSSAEGPGGIAVGLFLLLISVLYSLAIKSTVLAGNLTVAALAAFPLTYGALSAHGVMARAVSGSFLIFLYMFTYEVLKTIRDIDGDRAVGCITVATATGPLRTARLFRMLVVVFACAAIATPLWTEENLPYLAVMVPGCIVPVSFAAFMLPIGASATAVTRMLAVMVVAWFPGLLALSFHLSS